MPGKSAVAARTTSPSPRSRGRDERSSLLEGRGEGEPPRIRTRGESPHPDFSLRVKSDLSPQAGRGDLKATLAAMRNAKSRPSGKSVSSFARKNISLPRSPSPAVAQHQFKTEIDMARPGPRQHQFCRRAADGIAVNADGTETWRDQPAHFQIAEADDGDRLPGGRTVADQARGSQARHEADGMGVIGREHRVDTWEIRQRDHAA